MSNKSYTSKHFIFQGQIEDLVAFSCTLQWLNKQLIALFAFENLSEELSQADLQSGLTIEQRKFQWLQEQSHSVPLLQGHVH